MAYVPNYTARVEIRAKVYNGESYELDHKPQPWSFAPGSGGAGKRERVTVANAGFQALTPPTGAKAVLIILNGCKSITLKGVTGDTGTKIVPAAGYIGFDAFLPLDPTGASIGLANADAASATVDLIWL